MRIILLILIPPLLLFVFALIMMWIPLPPPLPLRLSQGRNQLVAVITGVLALGYIVGLAIYVISLPIKAARALDPVFTQRGLTAQSYLIFGRQYHGLIQGRQVDVSFTPSQGLRPALLDMHVAADLDTRVAIGEQKPLLDCADCPRVDMVEPDLSHLQILTKEPTWVRGLLADPTNREALNRLTSNQESLGFREMYFQPGRIWLRAHPSSQVTEAQIERWLDDLLALAKAAEEVK